MARDDLGAALARVGDEDRDAFREVYELTSARLFAICFWVCADRQAAEDVLHEVYITIWQRAGAWDPTRGTALTWLSTIARNRAIDWRRSHREGRFASIDEASTIVEPAPDAEAAIMAGQAARSVNACLAGLAQHKRDAIHSAFFHGETYAELAERRRVPLSTMKSWIRRGLAEMRRELDRTE